MTHASNKNEMIRLAGVRQAPTTKRRDHAQDVPLWDGKSTNTWAGREASVLKIFFFRNICWVHGTVTKQNPGLQTFKRTERYTYIFETFGFSRMSRWQTQQIRGALR